MGARVLFRESRNLESASRIEDRIFPFFWLLSSDFFARLFLQFQLDHAIVSLLKIDELDVGANGMRFFDFPF